MKQRILLFVLVLLSTLAASAYDAQIDGIYYNLIAKSKVAEVTGDGSSNLYLGGSYNNTYMGDITIPETVTYDGVTYTVTSIGQDAFYCCSGLTSVTIPNSVTSIGSNAFSVCSGLTSISISDLEAWCKIKFSNFTSNPLKYAQHFFIEGKDVTDIIIPDNITSIKDYVFYGFSGLKSITIHDNVTEIGKGVFSGCSGLTSITIPNSVTSLGEEAFSSCIGLTSVIIPNSVKEMGEGIFSGCSGLTSVTIPNSLTNISSKAFAVCTGLESVTIPNSVTSIGSNAFFGCIGLTSITIPNSVTSIGSCAFQECTGLTSIILPNNLIGIDYGVFKGCSGLTNISIPNSVSSIGWNAFENCSGLTSICLGSNVRSISMGNFKYCPELTDVYCYAENIPSSQSDLFEGSFIEYATLHVPESSINTYKNTAPWSGFGTIKALPGEKPKCATPTISFANGKIVFGCETEGVEFVSEVTSSDMGKYISDEIPVNATYTVSVYAIKDGYYNSDVATEEIYIGGSGGTSGIRGDANIDGEIGMADIMFIVQHILTGKFPDEDESASLSCPDGNHPHMIDLGMPSGTKWACCNVGASKPEGYGNYYAWGEVEPKSKYDVDTYIGFNYDELVSGITDIYGTEKDVAHVKWGDRWRIPTCSEIYELRDNSTYTEITYNGVKGIKFTGKNGNSIFLPAAGRYEGDQLVDNGVTGHYWQGSTSDEGTHTGEVPYYDRNMMVWGLTIRPVYANSTTR